MLQKIITHKKYLVGIALLVYLPTLFFSYVYLDDYLMVQEPGFHNHLSNIPASFFRSLWAHTSTAYQYYRPVSISLYILGTWITQQISGETLPWIYHLTNLILQGSVIALLFTLFLELGVAVSIAGLATLLFAIHPALAGTIGWIPGQNELLLAVLILGSFISLLKYLKNQKKSWLFLHGFLFLLALLTKENGAILPILCVLYLLSTNVPFKKIAWLKYFSTWAAAFTAWYLMMKQGAGLSAPVNEHVISSMIDGLHFCLVYIGKIFLPYPLYTLPTYEDTHLLTIIAGTIGVILMLLALWCSKNRWLSLMGIAWYFGFLIPTFARAGAYSTENFILREDRGYLAAIGIWILFLQLFKSKDVIRFKNNAKTKAIYAILVIFILLNLIHQQNYRSGKDFYSNAVKGSPRLAFAHTHLAGMYLAEKNFDMAIYEYKTAISLKRTEPQAHNNLGVAYMRLGNMDKALEQFEIELQYYPSNILSLYNSASILLKMGKTEEAEERFRKAVRINPVYTEAWRGLAHIYTMKKDDKKLEEVKKGLAQSEWDMSKGL